MYLFFILLAAAVAFLPFWLPKNRKFTFKQPELWNPKPIVPHQSLYFVPKNVQTFDFFEENVVLKKTTQAAQVKFGKISNLTVLLPVKPTETKQEVKNPVKLPGLELQKEDLVVATPLLKIDLLIASGSGGYYSVLNQPLIITSNTPIGRTLDFSKYVLQDHCGETLFLQREYLTSEPCANLIHIECEKY